MLVLFYFFSSLYFLERDLPKGFSITYYALTNYNFFLPLFLLMIILQKPFAVEDQLKIRFPTLTHLHLFSVGQIVISSISASLLFGMIGTMSIYYFQHSIVIKDGILIFVQFCLTSLFFSNVGILISLIQRFLSGFFVFFLLYGGFLLDFYGWNGLIGRFFGFYYTPDWSFKEIAMIFIRNIALFLLLFYVSFPRQGRENHV
jgi:hypothetical protein